MTAATTDLPLSFSVPTAFRQIDFAKSAKENTDKLVDELTRLTPRPTDEQIGHAVLAQQSMYELLAAAGAVYAGILLSAPTKDDEQQTLSSVMLTVTARPSEVSNEQTVKRLARTMGAIYPDAEVGVVDLDTGPAVMITEDSEVQRPVNLLGDGGDPVVVRQAHVFVPIPNHQAMADFSIATENLSDWFDCVDVLAQVCKTITFA